MKPAAVAPVLLAFLVVAAGAQDWSAFRGPRRDGVALDAKPPVEWSDTENVAWKTTLPGPGSSSPIVHGGRVYVACYSGYGAYLDDGGSPEALKHHLVCLDRDSGKILWTLTVAGALKQGARQVQINEHGFASPTPITDGQVIYTYFGHAGVVACDLEGGLLWQADLGTPTPDAPAATNSVERDGKTIPLRWGSAASPLLHGRLVIVNASEQSNSIRALDAKSGKLVWKRESANLEGSAVSPILVGPADRRTLVVGLAGAVWGLSPESGELVWEVETESRGGVCPTPVADDAAVYTFGGAGASYALAFATTLREGESRVRWRGANLSVTSPVLHDGRLLAVQDRGFGLCLDPAKGTTLFEERLEGRTGGIYASPVLAEERLYVVSRKRGTFVYSADGKFTLIAHNQLDDPGQFNASPAIVGKRLFLRSDTAVYCIASS